MIVSSHTVPFVDLTLQHQPIQAEIEQAMAAVVQRGDFILGKSLKEFEAEFAQASGVNYGVGVASGTDAIALGLQETSCKNILWYNQRLFFTDF